MTSLHRGSCDGSLFACIIDEAMMMLVTVSLDVSLRDKLVLSNHKGVTNCLHVQ